MKEKTTCGGSNKTWLSSINKKPNTDTEVKTVTTIRLRHSVYNQISNIAEQKQLSKSEVVRRLIDNSLKEV